MDYAETFAPVAKMTTVRTILAIAASEGWAFLQMDVKNAFLHWDLKEDIHMTPPQGLFSTPSSDVCHLKQSLYGLKQAPRALFDKFRFTLLDLHFFKTILIHLSFPARLLLGLSCFWFMWMIS